MNPDNRYSEFYALTRKKLTALYNQRTKSIDWNSFNNYASSYFIKRGNLSLEDDAETCARDFFETHSPVTHHNRVIKARFAW